MFHRQENSKLGLRIEDNSRDDSGMGPVDGAPCSNNPKDEKGKRDDRHNVDIRGTSGGRAGGINHIDGQGRNNRDRDG